MSKKSLFFVFILILFYLIIIQPYAAWFFTIDDMYIPLRYAKNWVEGGGLVWNKAEMPVEGYSNFSFVLLSAFALKLGINPVLILKSLGWISLSIITLGLYYLSRLWLSKELALLPSIALMAYKGEILWGVSGLETSFYQALIILSLYYLLRGNGYNLYPQVRQASHKNHLILSAIIMILASLTRPEAPFIALIFVIISWTNSDNHKDHPFLFLIVFSIGYIPYFLWRYFYYGYLFPNPVYCKGLNDAAFFSLDKSYLQLSWAFLIIASVNLFWNRERRYYYLLFPTLIYMILLVQADPIVAFYNRLFLPAFALILLLALIGLSQIFKQLIKNEFACTLIISSVFLVFIGLFIPHFTLNDYHVFSLNPQKGEILRKQVVSWLAENIHEPNEVVLADSGLIPYLSSFNFIDSYCLNNRLMAHVKTNRFHEFCKGVLKKRPEVIVLTSLIENKRVIYTPADKCLKKELKRNKSYKFRTYFQADDQLSSYRYEIYSALN